MRGFLFLNEIRIPTLAGLTIIILGMAVGIYLTLRQQSLTTEASPQLAPKNIKVTNVEDTSTSISWITDSEIAGFVLYSSDRIPEQTALDDMDDTSPSRRFLHHVSLKNLIPETTYEFKIVSGNFTTTPIQFTTARIIDIQNQFRPIVGIVEDEGQFLRDGLVYLEIPGAVTQSALIKSLGNFIIPLGKARVSDLSDIFKDKDAEARIIVVTDGQTLTSARVTLGQINSPVGPLVVGQNLDLTQPVASPSALLNFDLNGDGVINASDHSIVLNNFGRNPNVPGADINGDGVVDRKDLDIISAEIAKLEKD